MGRITDEDIERVRAAVDFAAIASEYIVLRPASRKFKACCPFHDEKTPSFQIDPDLKLWHCFGCGEGGDIFDFIKRIENVDFPDAVRLLASRYGIELTETDAGPAQPKGRKERLLAVCEQTAEFYHRTLMRGTDTAAAGARTYLSGRGFGADVCKRWRLGYAPGRGALVAYLRKQGFSSDEMVDANVALRDDSGRVRDRFYQRAMFPICDKLGKVIAFGGRIIGSGEPKYLNSSETLLFHKSSNMYGLNHAKNSITSEACAVVVEGYTDCIALHEAGIKNVVATLGTALTTQHIKQLRNLRPRRIVYLFDGDSAGQKAADRAVELIDWSATTEPNVNQIDFLVTVLPDNQDPAEYCAKVGAEGMQRAIATAIPLIRFAIDRRLAAWDLSSTGQRTSALNEAVALLTPIKDSLAASDYANYIADILGCELSTVRAALAASRPRRPVRENEAKAAPIAVQQSAAPETPMERTEREMLGLLVKYPRLITALGNVRRFEWNSPLAGSLAQLLLQDASSGNMLQGGSAALVARLEEKAPGAAVYLSAGTVETADEEQASRMVATMLVDLIENDLQKRIRLGNARLKNPDEMSAQEYDDTFKQIAALQKELKAMRMAREGQVI